MGNNTHKNAEVIPSAGESASLFRQSCEGRPHTPHHGIGRTPRTLVRKDMRPGVLSQHKEHEDIEQSQEINIDSSDALITGVALKNGCGVEGDGNILKGLLVPRRPVTRSPALSTWRHSHP